MYCSYWDAVERFAIHYQGVNMTAANPRCQQMSELFETRPCWTIGDLARELQYSGVSTRRLLSQVGYYSSFTHNSAWYTLQQIPRFDHDGLWFHQDIGFSRRRSLTRTLVYLAEESPAGMTAAELGQRLHCRCHGVLFRLCRQGKLRREKLGHCHVYLALDPTVSVRQREQWYCHAAPARHLPAEIAVLILAAFIRQPQATCEELARLVGRQTAMSVSALQVEQLFAEHGVKRRRPVSRTDRLASVGRPGTATEP